MKEKSLSYMIYDTIYHLTKENKIHWTYKEHHKKDQTIKQYSCPIDEDNGFMLLVGDTFIDPIISLSETGILYHVGLKNGLKLTYVCSDTFVSGLKSQIKNQITKRIKEIDEKTLEEIFEIVEKVKNNDS